MPYTVDIIYSSGRKITGQAAASEFLASLLRVDAKAKVSLLAIPYFERSSSKSLWVTLQYLIRLSLSYLMMVPAIFRHSTVILNVAQTRFGLFRDGIPYYILRILGGKRGIISLHGSLFVGWQKSDCNCILLLRLIKCSEFVTVLGVNHKAKLIDLGVAESKIVIIPNSTSLRCLSESEVCIKHTLGKGQRVRLLFLSNLIESKGFLIFLEALTILANQKNLPPFEAILCGQLMLTATTNVNGSVSDHSVRIEETIKTIKKIRPGSSLTWVQGAYGDDKIKAFHNAQIFVFPSYYAVEAQPIVIIEALSAGCAIITSDIGEIVSTVGQSAVVTSDVSPANIARLITNLMTSEIQRREIALKGIERFAEKFTPEKHLELWIQLLAKCER